MHNLAPIDEDADVVTKQYVDSSGFVAYVGASVASHAVNTTLLTLTTDISRWGGFTLGGQSGSSLIVPVTGLYEVGISGGFGSNGSGTHRYLGIWHNGTNGPSGQGTCGQFITPTVNTSGLGAALSSSVMWSLTAGDLLTGHARQDCGAALAVSANLWGKRIR